MFRVGQLVVCIREFTSRRPHKGEVFPTKGMVYTVRDVKTDGLPRLDCTTYIHLDEIVNPKGPFTQDEPYFHALNFRPVRTTSIDVFDAMLKPVKEDA